MIYEFLSFDELLRDCEVKIMNSLYEYSLLDKFSLDVKKILLYYLVHEFSDKLKNPKLLIYHSKQISKKHELVEYYEKKDLDILFNRLCSKIKKITGRLFFISDRRKLPNAGVLEKLDGEVIDEIILLDNIQPDIKKLKEFLHSHKMKELFTSIVVT